MRTFSSMLIDACAAAMVSGDAENAVWGVLDFDGLALTPDEIAAMVAIDASLSVMDESGGHCSINYPDELTLANIVTTNVQERLFESAKKCLNKRSSTV